MPSEMMGLLGIPAHATAQEVAEDADRAEAEARALAQRIASTAVACVGSAAAGFTDLRAQTAALILANAEMRASVIDRAEADDWIADVGRRIAAVTNRALAGAASTDAADAALDLILERMVALPAEMHRLFVWRQALAKLRE